MGIAHFQPATAQVVIPSGGQFAVRGLSLEDITVLLRAHYDTARHLFERYVTEAALQKLDEERSGGILGLANAQDLLLEVLESAPAFIGDLIARGADETENPHRARLLPIGVQIEAVEKIVMLTLEAEGGLEKLGETVAKLAGSLTSLTADRSR